MVGVMFSDCGKEGRERVVTKWGWGELELWWG